MQPVVIHAHFYQPERVNPWTGVLDSEPSASPDRDWNERVHRECYRPNSVARIFDDQRRVEQLVNNYERLSFNMGPTLLAWMERAHPSTYARILDADWRSAVRTGHGNAIAQAYNHMILPLADPRDVRTQIRWGLADFRHRFSRQAEGMWLPEAAVDRSVVDALIDEGVRFTVLAPHQAGRVRHRGGAWHDRDGPVDTSRPYRHLHSDGSGRSLAIYFYDGALSQSLAFDPSTHDARVLVDRLLHAGTDGGLVHAAVDGETFGHHHAFGELGLAYALTVTAPAAGLEPTNYAAHLAAHPPVDDVELAAAPTSWSCVHGVGRWQRDCGCSTDAEPGWNQRWRTPLREALDLVREAAVHTFTTRGAKLLRDPWRARDAYIGVVLRSTEPSVFLSRHARSNLTPSEQTDVWTLLEAMRHAMTMYTSCGWFFADISGIESVYVMRSAARVLDLLRQVGAEVPEEELFAVLEGATSNRPEMGTGADVWRREVTRSVVTPERVAAHITLLSSVRPPTPGQLELSGYRATLTEERREQRGQLAMTTLRILLTSVATSRTTVYGCAAVHLGGLDFTGALVRDVGAQDYRRAATVLWDAFPTAGVGRLIRLMNEHFDGMDFGLEAALAEGRNEIARHISDQLEHRFSEEHQQLYARHRRELEMLRAAGYGLPRPVLATAELALSAQLSDQVARALGDPSSDGNGFASVRRILETARDNGYELDLEPLRMSLTDNLTAAAQAAVAALEPSAVGRVDQWLDLSRTLGVSVDMSRAQEAVYEVASRARAGRLTPAETEVVGLLGERLGLARSAWSRDGTAVSRR